MRILGSEFSSMFGLGPGSLQQYFTHHSVSDGLAATFDNSYLSLWHDYGAITLAVLVSLLSVGIARRSGSPPGRLLLLSTAVSIFFFDFYAWPLMLGVIMLAVGLREMPDSASPPDPTVSISAARTFVKLRRGAGNGRKSSTI